MEDLLSRITDDIKFVYPWRVNGEDRIHVLKRLLKNPKHVLTMKPEVFSKVMRYEDAAVINVCLPFISDVNAVLNKQEMTALHLAAQRGLVEVASRLLELGARTDSITWPLQQTPLHIAANEGNPKMIELLSRNGANVNARDAGGLWGGTPLLTICRNSMCGDPSISIYKSIKILLENGAEVNIPNSFKDLTSPLIVSIRNKWNIGKVESICHLLFKGGADPNLADSNRGTTPLHYLAMTGRQESYDDILAVAELLLNEGACINKTDIYGDTPLHFAFEKRKWFLVDFLVENGADLNLLVETGGNLGAENGNLQMLSHIKYSMMSSGYIIPSAYDLATSYALKLKCSSRSIEELVLLSHLALKIVNGSHVCERAMKCIERQESLKHFLKNCIEEVNALKARTIKGTNLTFCDIVHCDRTIISKFQKNKNLVRALKANHKSFPIYGRCLKRKLDEILRRREEEKFTLKILSHICDFAPPTFLDRMMEQFSSTERKILIEAFTNDCFGNFSISDMLDIR